ncbi:epidermal growth factor receptor kinase substrate 8-like protein 2 isoform X2 [Vespa velutina]|uniref:epidermal growth factor receptor kinase substrate 8-like protein 2 isoform X2 n=1 Tax=Vespa velutina TaxID=202808 RepID=UPI001FB3BC89|nr:epidermal growth factor receptor kinase substrate 8-like protein 2 isoform X2 [Vespa velutina]
MPYYNSSHSPAVYNKDGGSSGPSSTSGGRGSSTEPPTYMMEHLATFTVTKEIGIVYPADGMRRLLQLEKSNGIWSQKMQLRLERNWVLIMDNETGAVMERFPASLIQEPTAFTSRDPMEMYNNILVFSVADDSGSQRAEMHIFQCQSVSAQDLVEDLKMLQMGKLVPGGSPRGPRGQIPPPPALPPPEPPLNGVNVREQVSAFNAANADGQNDISREENNDEVSSTSSEKYERDVTILNHCFDDIEKFIARLQYAAAASRELERRRRNRKSKKRNLGDGMLTMRAKPPPEMEFIDIFQKFKLSFNLLAKLKAHIHDPNAPELVHFLFTPLALIVDASHDTNYEPNLPSKVVSPLLTREAVNLLINCVTSKETELWHSLGDMWLIPRDQWKGHVPPYHPIFTDGWSPEYPIPEDRDHDHLASLLNADKQKRDELPEQQNDPYYNHRDVDESHYSSDYLEYDIREDRAGTENFDRNYGTTSELYAREERVEQTRAHSDISVDSIERAPRGAAIERAQEVWLDELVNRNAKIVHVTYPRTANNDKELTVVRGEYLEILDDSRKWWKARNSRGQVAHVPHTIVTPHNPSQPAENDVFNNPLYTSRYPRQGHGYSYEDSEIERTSTSPGPEAAHRTHAIPPPAPADWVRKERLGKKASPAPPASQTPSAPPPLPVPPALSPPPPPPPPPPVLQTQKSTTSTGSNKSELYKNNKSLAGTCNQDQVQEELKHVLNMFRQKKRSPNILEMQATVLHQYSTPREVQSWLTAKGFSDKVCKQLKDMTGAEIFNLTKRQLEQYFGPNEGERLEKQLILSRNECGYETTRVSELKQILEKVRQKAE